MSICVPKNIHLFCVRQIFVLFLVPIAFVLCIQLATRNGQLQRQNTRIFFRFPIWKIEHTEPSKAEGQIAVESNEMEVQQHWGVSGGKNCAVAPQIWVLVILSFRQIGKCTSIWQKTDTRTEKRMLNHIHTQIEFYGITLFDIFKVTRL